MSLQLDPSIKELLKEDEKYPNEMSDQEDCMSDGSDQEARPLQKRPGNAQTDTYKEKSAFPTTKAQPKKRRQSEDIEIQKLTVLKEMSAFVQNASSKQSAAAANSEATFGHQVAIEISNIKDNTLRISVKRKIMNIIYEAQESEQFGATPNYPQNPPFIAHQPPSPYTPTFQPPPHFSSHSLPPPHAHNYKTQFDHPQTHGFPKMVHDVED